MTAIARISTGLLVVCVAILTQMLSVADIDGSLLVAVFCLAVAIPGLTLLAIGFESRWQRANTITKFVSWGASFLGLNACFGHFSGYASVTFFFAAVLATVLLVKTDKEV